MHRLSQIAQLTLREWADLATSVWELAVANRVLARNATRRIGQAGPRYASGLLPLNASQARLINRVAWALPRAGNVVPWRADCLRQADAGRRWLGRHGIVSEIRLGARLTVAGTPEMHAWLVVGEQVVTGGEIASYTPFSESS